MAQSDERSLVPLGETKKRKCQINSNPENCLHNDYPDNTSWFLLFRRYKLAPTKTNASPRYVGVVTSKQSTREHQRKLSLKITHNAPTIMSLSASGYLIPEGAGMMMEMSHTLPMSKESANGYYQSYRSSCHVWLMPRMRAQITSASDVCLSLSSSAIDLD